MRGFLNLFWCMHFETLKRHDPVTGRFFLECASCPWTSEGILTGPAHQTYNERGWRFEEEGL